MNKEDAVYRERKRWGFFGIPFTFTVYLLNEEFLTVEKGFLNRVEDDCYLYKIQDVKLKRTFFNRIFGIGSVVCYTGDFTDTTLIIKNVKNSREIKDYILKKSEECRLKRRTLNTQNIGIHPDMFEELDADGIPEDI